jgi:lysophospholipase L1-like esterase
MIDGGIQAGGMEATVYSSPYQATFTGLTQSEHTVSAVIVDDLGQEVLGETTQDQVTQVGIGDYYVAIGDSITYGVGDDYPADNNSNDGRNTEGGYAPILNNLLTSAKGYPHTVAKEGVPGYTSVRGLDRLPSVIEQHPNSQYYLILYGTNDSGGALPLPSGQGLNPGDAGYTGSFKDIMQQIIDLISAAGKQPYLAKIPFTLKGVTRNDIIQEYNIVIDELISSNGITVVPPDFYTYYENHQTEMSDDLHPNGIGYQAMANLWFNALP